MSYFTNTHYVCQTTVTKNLQVVILLQFLNCIYSHTSVCKLHCGRTTWRSDPDPEALRWKQVNQHHEGRLVPPSGCSRGLVGLPAIPWGTAPITLDTPRTGWSTNAFCPTGSSSGLCWAFCLVAAGVCVTAVIPPLVVKLQQTPSLRKGVFSTLNAVWGAGNRHLSVLWLECVGEGGHVQTLQHDTWNWCF